MSALVQIYIKKIEKGEIYLEDVPIRWRSEVEKELNKSNSEHE